MAVFYQKYRPKTFAEVIGQSVIVQTLQNSVSGQTFGHAYLFTGGRGLGKTTLARIMAKAVNCQNVKAGNPCGVCDICTAIANGKFLDCIEIDAASHTGVDNIRELIEHISFKPTLGKMKVFVIDEVHMLSKAAFNALLKTLEEPPAHVMFILATTDLEKVPETIISRVQRFDFKKMTNEDILRSLQAVVKTEKLSLPEDSLQIIVENSEGGMRDALSQLSTISVLTKDDGIESVEQLLGVTDKKKIEKLLNLIVLGKLSDLSGYFDDLAGSSVDFLSFNKKLLQILKIQLENKLTNTSGLESFEGVSLADLMHMIRLFLRSYKELDNAMDPVLPILLASAEACLKFTKSTNTDVSAPRVVSSNAEVLSNAVVVQSEPQTIEDSKPMASIKKNIAPSPPDMASESNLNKDVTLEQVKQFWTSLVDALKQVNSPLSTLLRNSPLKSVENGIITCSVKFLFHQENLENLKNKTLIEQLIADKFGYNLKFKTTIIAKEKNTEEQASNYIADALQIFGGELVE